MLNRVLRIPDVHSLSRIPNTDAIHKTAGRFAGEAIYIWRPGISARLERENALDAKASQLAWERLAELACGWHEVEPGETVKESAKRFLRVHPLRAADALQLAAAFVAAEGRPRALPFVTLDERLADAARKEGFALVDLRAP